MSTLPGRGYLHFVWAGLIQHAQTGGIVPSQRFLVGRMIEPVPRSYRGQVIELGAGNGALTLRLAARCPDARILACELNPALAQDTEFNIAAAGLSGRVQVAACSAEQLLCKATRQECPQPDYVISGIPLGNLGRQRTLALIELIGRTLSPTGLYVQFQHSLLDRKNIRTRFADVRTVPVFLNIPPAVVYYARGPTTCSEVTS
jgi:phospholipid N-methyltransferase